MKLFKITDFLNQVDTSRSTIYRLLNKHPHLEKRTKLVNYRRLIPIDFKKYFDLDEMIKDEKRLLEDIADKKELIDLIIEDKNNANFFWEKEWDLFVTISYQNDVTSLGCHNKMSKLFDNIKHNYEHLSNFRMLFTTEEYNVREGRHNHFVFHSSNKEVISKIKGDIKNQFPYDHVYIDDYNKYKPGVHYICKYGLKSESWDFLH